MKPALLSACLSLAASLVPVLARADDCDVVRRARALLVQRGLDDSSLRAIEPSVCAPVATPVVVVQPQPQPRPHGQQSPACADYRTMLAVADVDPSRLQSQHRQLIEQMASGACRGWSAPREAWPNGIIARDTDTSLRWPTGLTARDAQGNWSYPNGVTMRRADRWYWPNGVTALDGRGEWYAPNGLRTAPAMLLAEACRVSADPRFCGRAWGQPSPFEFIGFVWRARGGR